MSNRPPKRAHFGGAFHDPIPFTDDFSVVHASEGRVKRVGNESLSIPGERVPLHQADLTWDSAPSWLPIDDPQYALDPDGEWYDEAVGCDVMAEDSSAQPTENSNSATKKTRVRSKTSVCPAHLTFDIAPDFRKRRPHVFWRDVHRQVYLEEMIRWAGRGDFCGTQDCPDCVARGSAEPGRPEYRCRECAIADLVCKTCCVKRHRVHPLHRIEVCTFLFFFFLTA